MNYYLDTEFLEGTQTKRFLGFPYGKTKPTIDLISIGIVAEDGRSFYAISKDFNLREAWNRYDVLEQTPFEKYNGFSGRKVYWIRENVLKPIFRWWYAVHNNEDPTVFDHKFTYKEFKKLLLKEGKSNKQIAKDILHFTNGVYKKDSNGLGIGLEKDTNQKFYAYYGDYDWVAFCWLFGKMIDLPKGFPMYATDLKQILDSKIELMSKYKCSNPLKLEHIDSLAGKGITLGQAENIDWNKWFNEHPNYPKQTNEHNALYDARWNKQLHEFLNSI